MLQPGTPIDRYVVQHLLGRGGMASVYAVKHAVLGTRHALKVLHTTAPGVHERLVREGQVQARLDPAHVVPVTDVLQVGGAPALLMPLVEGCSLAEALEDRRLSEAEVAALFQGVVAGVMAAHSAGVIHRDLKPANVLLEVKRGVVVVRVADFGLARPESDDLSQTQVGVFMGTPAYASPEQLVDVAGVDHRADLWSLGVMLFEMLTGARPFDQGTLPQLRQAVSAADYDRDAIPDRWRALVAALLEPDRERRAASADEVDAALAGVLRASELVIGDPVAEVVRRRIEQGRQLENVEPVVGLTTLDFGATASPAQTAPPPHSLPSERDAFVGRHADLSTLQAQVTSEAHLVSVLGTGGSGKTRLVLHYAWQHLAQWPGGIWFCDLSEARSVDGIVAAVARGLDVPVTKGDPVVQLGHAIAGRDRCLVILDNFEQVTRFADETLGRWLDVANQAVFVVTSREVLGLPGEAAVPLAPLAATDSVDLFIARATAARPGFAPDADQRAAIDQLVALLDRLPLAIELAAARVRVLPPSKLLARMTDRFRLLTSAGGRRDRQATLRATLDWSWELLSPWEQSALAQVSVFEGGFDLEAAEGVVDLEAFDEAPWAMDVVQALVDKSLVRTVGDDRFDLLVSVQEYAAGRLDELSSRASAEEQHGRWYAGFGTEAAMVALEVHGGTERMAALRLELDNLVVANGRAVRRQDAAVAVSTALATWAVVAMTGPASVAVSVFDQTLALPGLERRDVVRLEGGAVRALALSGSPAAARTKGEAALSRARALGDPALIGAVILAAAEVDVREGELLAARDKLHEARDAGRAVGDPRLTMLALGNLGSVAMMRGESIDGLALFVEVLTLARASGSRWVEARALGAMATTLKVVGRTDESITCAEEALVVARAIGARSVEASVLAHLSDATVSRGDADAATAYMEDGIALARLVGNPLVEGVATGNLGVFRLLSGDVAEARRCYRRALEIHTELGFAYGRPYWMAGLAKTEDDLDSALILAQAAVTAAEPFPMVYLNALGTLAEIRLKRGETAEAREAMGHIHALDRPPSMVGFVAALDALVAVAEHDRPGAEAHIAEAEASDSSRDPRMNHVLDRARAGLAHLDRDGG